MFRRASVLLTVAGALALAGCGGAQHPHARTAKGKPHRGPDIHTVWIYSSLPQSGPEATDSLELERGISLALWERRDAVGDYQVKYRALSDSARHASSYSPSLTVRNAVQAARNPQTIAYIGDLDSGATALSLPILNQAGIEQLTPGSGYPGLTDSVQNVTAPGEPGIYYPSGGTHTLLRLVPSDLVQAAAAVDYLKNKGCHQLAVWQFPAAAGGALSELTKAIIATAPRYGLPVAKTGAQPAVTKPESAVTKQYYDYLHALGGHPNHIDCAVLTGAPSHAAALFTDYLHGQLDATILGSDAFCNRSWTSSFTSAVARAVDGSLYCLSPLRPLRSYRESGAFRVAYRARYRQSPQIYAYLGYQAARLILTAMFGLSDAPDHRTTITTNLLGSAGPLGPFMRSGDPVSSTYEIETIGSHGRPVPDHAVVPPDVLGVAAEP